MTAISSRQAGAAAAVAAALALGIAYYAEFVLHLVPCPLCYIERWPYRIAIVLGILVAVAPPRAGRALLALAALVMLGDAAIAFVHVGAEQHWWNSPLPECNAPPPGFGALPLRPSASCDAPTYLIPGFPVSFATMDLVYALGFALAILAYLKRSKRSLP
ncbi:disulfide bond formation protein B [Acidiphilium sp. AL]|uniref:Disulfide bond formation protein B n=1 Tax=Acidiphilium iwatense TaxID=768198 RepID=A0ABS9DY43_9PROT|nr:MULTISPECIES: disulfide bond formation protein B [Acidiphilium]MCF3946244.1 disulfide bond formation protein B [Acidiphilium iwatense]MCU4158816.1 disulfide bond formation protein B [Acidiphilium sp. AL]